MTIDPNQVPAFPNYFLRFATHPGTIELDGLPIEPAADESARTAAINAVAIKARTHNLSAVRVTVEDQDGDQHAMIVTGHGEVIELAQEDDDEAKARRPLWRNPFLLSGTALLVVATAGVGAAVALNLSAQDEDDQPPPWQPPGAEVEIPAALPEGYAQTATWSLPVADRAGAIALPDGRLLTGETDGTMTARDPATAEPSWAGAEGPSDLNELQPITWEGEHAIATTDNQALYVWPLDHQGRDAAPADPLTFDLTNRAEVSFTDYPLISLGDFVVAVPHLDDGEPALEQVTIPAGTQPVAATATEVVSIDGDQVHVIPVQEGEGEAAEVPLDVAEDHAGDQPTDVWPLTDGVTLAMWETEDSDEGTHAALFDLNSGDRLASATIESTPQANADLRIDHEQQIAILDTTVLDYSEAPHIGVIPALDDPTIAGQEIYGQTNDGLAAVPLPDEDDPILDEDDLSYYDTIGDEDSPPELIGDDAAYISAPRLDETILYRADAANGPADDEAGDTDDQDSADTEE